MLSGETILWQWGPLTLRQEGCLATVLIVGRFFSIFTLGLVLLGTSPFLTTVRAMRSLGLPQILADMMLLTYRYLQDFATTLNAMQQAMKLRGFHSRYRSGSLGPALDRNFQLFASLVGTLLVRSYEQSERIYKAMCLRGYGRVSAWGRHSMASIPKPSPGTRPLWNGVALGFVLLLSVAFVTLEVLWT